MAGKRKSLSTRPPRSDSLMDRAIYLSSLANARAAIAFDVKRLIEVANHLRTDGAEIRFGVPHELVIRRSSDAAGAVFDSLADGMLEIALKRLEAEGA